MTYLIILVLGGVVLTLAFLLGKSKQRAKQSKSQLAKKDKGLADARKVSDDITRDSVKRARVRDYFR